jgi:hypothetical protein
MQEWLTAQMASRFSAFEGAALTGSIPVKEELINELIAGFLAQAGQQPEATAAPAVDVRTLVSFVRQATIRAEPGVVTLHFEVRI